MSMSAKVISLRNINHMLLYSVSVVPHTFVSLGYLGSEC